VITLRSIIPFGASSAFLLDFFLGFIEKSFESGVILLLGGSGGGATTALFGFYHFFLSFPYHYSVSTEARVEGGA